MNSEPASFPPVAGTAENEQYLPRDERRHIPREAILLSAIALVLAAVLRLIRLGYREMFGPEFVALSYATELRPDLLEAVFRGHLSLYYELLRGWTRLVGETSEFWLRLPSAMLGLLACVAFFIFAQRFLRGTAFVICLLGFALNPLLVATSIEATPFAALSLLVVLSNYFCIRAVDEGGRRNWARYGFFTILGALTHPLFWFVMLAQFIFGIGRPRKTPRQFVLISIAGIFVLVLVMIAAVVFAENNLPRALGVQRPSIGDLARGIVAVSLGDFPRYGYGGREFARVIMYLFVIVTLALSFLYYRIRAREASAIPENILWIDETQDVVGKWMRLSLASFLLFQWMTFLIPAFCLMLLASVAPEVRLAPEYFIICLPSLVILIACGIDAVPSRVGQLLLGVVFVVIMSVYDARALSDTGLGVKEAVWRLQREDYDPRQDALLIVTYPALREPLQFYAKQYREAVLFPTREPEDETVTRIEQSLQGKERAFVLYHNDLRSMARKLKRSAAREWFASPKSPFELDKRWLLSDVEGVEDDTELHLYQRNQTRR